MSDSRRNASIFNRVVTGGLTLLLLLLSGCSAMITSHPVRETGLDDCVVLVHGLWRSERAMRSIDNYLRDMGYQTERISYPSTSEDIPRLSREYLAPAVDACSQKVAGRVHIVTHSMGGILARYYLQDHDLPNNGRLVMISPPNHGSKLAEFFRDWPLLSWVMGPAAQQLSEDDRGILKQISPAHVEIGIIAGTRNYSLLADAILPEPHDGIVSLQSTPLPEMKDFITVDNTHINIRYDRTVQFHVDYFLRHGNFLASPGQRTTEQKDIGAEQPAPAS